MGARRVPAGLWKAPLAWFGLIVVGLVLGFGTFMASATRCFAGTVTGDTGCPSTTREIAMAIVAVSVVVVGSVGLIRAVIRARARLPRTP
jgi:hypothetical protein